MSKTTTTFTVQVNVYKPEVKGSGPYAALVVIPIIDKGEDWGAVVNYFGNEEDGVCNISQATTAWHALSTSIEAVHVDPADWSYRIAANEISQDHLPS